MSMLKIFTDMNMFPVYIESNCRQKNLQISGYYMQLGWSNFKKVAEPRGCLKCFGNRLQAILSFHCFQKTVLIFSKRLDVMHWSTSQQNLCADTQQTPWCHALEHKSAKPLRWHSRDAGLKVVHQHAAHALASCYTQRKFSEARDKLLWWLLMAMALRQSIITRAVGHLIFNFASKHERSSCSAPCPWCVCAAKQLYFAAVLHAAHWMIWIVYFDWQYNDLLAGSKAIANLWNI